MWVSEAGTAWCVIQRESLNLFESALMVSPKNLERKNYSFQVQLTISTEYFSNVVSGDVQLCLLTFVVGQESLQYWIANSDEETSVFYRCSRQEKNDPSKQMEHIYLFLKLLFRTWHSFINKWSNILKLYRICNG